MVVEESPASVHSLLGRVVLAGRQELGAAGVLIAAAHDRGWLVQAYAGQDPGAFAPGTRLDPHDLPSEEVCPVEVHRREDGSVSLRSVGDPLTPTTRGGGFHTVVLLRERVGEQRLLLVVERAELQDGELHEAVRRLLDAVQDSLTIQLTEQEQRVRAGLREREEERRRWARELHDETLQELGALHVLLTSVRQAASTRLGADDPLVSSVDTAVSLLRGQITALRHLITELRPAALDELGLGPPLVALAERAEAQGLGVALELSLRHEDGRSPTRLLPDVELAVYRVVQEALTNAARHSGAKHVRVTVQEDEDRICAEVADDGRGWGTATAGFGLTGMRERAALVKGFVDVVPGGIDGHGTSVRLVVPAQHRRDASDTRPGTP